MLTKIKHEVYRGLILTLYFTIFFIALDYFHYATLKVAKDVTNDILILGVVKAGLCAKFLMISQQIFPIKLNSNYPLIIHIFRRSLLYVIMVIILMALEEIVMARIHHENILNSITGLKPGSGIMFSSLAFLYWVMVVPYAMFSALNTYWGDNKLVKLFLSTSITNIKSNQMN